MALSDEQLRQWDERGAVTVETPLVDDPALLARVREAMLGGMPWTHDNNFNPLPKPGRVTAAFPPLAKNDWLDWGSPSPLLQVAGLPWFEAAARQCLRAERVRYCATGLSASYPEEGPWSCGQHIDLQYRLECVSPPFLAQRRVCLSGSQDLQAAPAGGGWVGSSGRRGCSYVNI